MSSDIIDNISDITYYRDFTKHNSTFIALRNKDIVYIKLEELEGKQHLWFYLRGVGRVSSPLVVNSGVKIDQLIELFMRKE